MSKVKICGLRRPEDIDAVNLARPDFIGFVFAESRRRVNERTAFALRERLDDGIRAVGVFVNADIGLIARLFKSGIIGLAQLHGDEDEAYIRRLREACGCPVIKAVGISGALPSLPEDPDYLMFDTVSAQRGGVGRAFDWSLLKDYDGPPYFLAGGLTAENVTGALGRLDPFCVDVSSGVETDGWKDAEKIETFVGLVRRL